MKITVTTTKDSLLEFTSQIKNLLHDTTFVHPTWTVWLDKGFGTVKLTRNALAKLIGLTQDKSLTAIITKIRSTLPIIDDTYQFQQDTYDPDLWIVSTTIKPVSPVIQDPSLSQKVHTTTVTDDDDDDIGASSLREQHNKEPDTWTKISPRKTRSQSKVASTTKTVTIAEQPVVETNPSDNVDDKPTNSFIFLELDILLLMLIINSFHS